MPQDQDWVALYEYVHDKVMGYDKTIKLSKQMVLRLKGMVTGQFIANKNQKQNAQYDFKTILITFKMCSPQILQGFEANKTAFKNEMHKFNYAMTIIDSNINDVVLRLKNAKKSEEKTENIKLDNQVHEGAEYKTKNKKINDNLKELW